MLIDGVRIVLLGAEGCSEMRDEPFLVDPTEEQKIAFYDALLTQAQHKKPETKDATHFNVDGNGRPYWVKVVTDEAPENIRKAAENAARCVRLTL